MELKQGYKQTEVGMIPEDWEARLLGSLTTLMTNGFVGIATTAYVDYDEGVLYVQGYNVEENGFNFHGIKRVSNSFHAKNKKSCLQSGDLLTIQTGNIGVTTIVPPSLAGANCHALVISRFDKRVSESVYYCQYFNSERGRIAFKEIETGSTMKHLNVGDMVKLYVPSPPLSEQRAIATALSDVDALLVAQDKLISKKRDIKQAAMQQLLTGKQRLPGFTGEWVGCELKRFVREFIVPMRDKPKRLTGNIPWCRIEDFDGMYLKESKSGQNVDEQTVIEMNLKVYPTGTLLVSCSADLGRCAIVKIPLVSNQTFIGLNMDDAVSSKEFFYYYMTAKAGELNKLSSGTTISYLSREQFEVFPIFAPPTKDEQYAIATILSDMDADLTALEQQSDKTRALKQGMMQELLTGRIRLV